MNRPDRQRRRTSTLPARSAALVAILLLLLRLPGFALAQEAKPAPAPAAATATATAATTAPVAAPPSPKAVALAFAAALDKGDAAAAKALLPADGDDTRAKWVEATVALSTALRKLDAAAVARFGEPGKSVSQNQLNWVASLKAIEQAQEKIDGDSATLTLPGQPRPLLLLRKVDGQWRLVAGPTPGDAPAQLALYQRLHQAVTRTTEEIAAGAHPSADAAARVFAGRVMEARLKP